MSAATGADNRRQSLGVVAGVQDAAVVLCGALLRFHGVAQLAVELWVAWQLVEDQVAGAFDLVSSKKKRSMV